MVEITMGGWGNSPIYRVILTFCFTVGCIHVTVMLIVHGASMLIM